MPAFWLMYARGMKSPGSLLAVLPLLLANALSAPAQSPPVSPADAEKNATLEAQRDLEESSVRILQGRPAVAIISIANVDGAASGLSNTSVRDTAELVLRQNGIPVVPSCDGGTANCGRLVRAKCQKGLVLPDPTGLCAVYINVGYREAFHSGRAQSVPVNVLGEVLDDDSVGLLTDKFEEQALKRVTEWVEKFALSYLRANPAK
jgi:hypothetical protein